MSVREASHAGSWYPRSPSSLKAQLESYVADTDASKHSVTGCRLIISPHAGYSYSGPTAAYGFKALDWTGVRRVFILGPSHHFYLKGCALSQCSTYATPLGELKIDVDLIKTLHDSGRFDKMSLDVDEDEHSIEMQLPFLRMVMAEDVPVVPILVGNLSYDSEKAYGELLSPYLQDKQNLFVISSDFCHWGRRFSYSYKYPTEQQQPIWKSIEMMDKEGMSIIETGSHKAFSEYLQRTKNTICGRHPIGVALAALESAQLSGRFKFLDYRQSNKVTSTSDGSVSYASGVCCP